MEKEYDKIIHHASTLITTNQYSRAYHIMNQLMQQGILNSQIVVIQSYCLKMLKGTKFAIQFLSRYESVEGPLLRFTLAQYYKQLKNNQQCLDNLAQIQKTNNQTGKASVIMQSSKSLQVVLQYNKPGIYERKYGNLDVEAINQINDIVEQFKLQQLSPVQTKVQFQGIIKQRKVMGIIRQYVQKFIKYLQYQIELRR